MAQREFEREIVSQVVAITGWRLSETPKWLMRPGRIECGAAWPLVRDIYRELTGKDLPDEMPSRERRIIDAVLIDSDGRSRFLEVDEKQHFNSFRAATLSLYPDDTPIAFDREMWTKASRMKTRLEGGGFGRPCPPLFPMEGGRHRQRAFRDALADLLPPVHNFLPTLRIAHFELQGIIVRPKVEELLMRKLGR